LGNFKNLILSDKITLHLNEDVIVANTMSKSTLRYVAGTLAEKYEYVDYFPSFEIIMNSPREITWEPDHAHVKAEAVSFVVKTFIGHYAGD
jgi:hypothetical protein